MQYLLPIFFILTVANVNAGSISGKIYDNQSLHPLNGVNIEILDTSFGTASDSTGSFSIYDIPDGDYSLRATHVGYKIIIRKIKISDKMTKPLVLHMESVPIEGREILVIASANPNSAQDRTSPIAFRKIDKEEISFNYTTGDIPDLIKNVPGVWTSSSGLGETDISIRGFGTDHVYIMLNDIQINNPEDHKVSWSDWAGLSHMAKTIEVHRGPGYSLQSQNSFGGSINISTIGITPRQQTTFRVSVGMYDRMGIQSGADAGKVIDPWSGEVAGEADTPVNYTYSARFNSGSLYDGKLYLCLFIERKFGDSYLLGARYDGYTIGLEAESKLADHQFYSVFFISPQSHQQAFALQDIDLLKTLGREYNRKSHEWQENSYTKPFWSVKHEWSIAANQRLTNNFFITMGKGADQTCTNDAFDVTTGKVDFQESMRGLDAFAFGMHAQYLYKNYGIMTTDFQPGPPFFVFSNIPFETKDGEGANFFTEQYTHSYQDRRRRDHWQIGLNSFISHGISENIHFDYGIDLRYWRGHRESEVRMLKISDMDPMGSLWTPAAENIFISQVQSIYNYDTEVFNFSLFTKVILKPFQDFTLQGGLPFNYTRSEVIENPIQLIDFGTWNFFSSAKRTTVDISEYGSKFSITNDYLRQYSYISPWLGLNYNFNQYINSFMRIASAKKEPAILDWYDPTDGPLLQSKFYPDSADAVSIDPERLTSLELGIGYIEDHFSVRANYYYSLYKDKIERVVDINDRYTTMNAGEASFQGIEFLVNWNLKNLDLLLSTTFARNRWEKMNVKNIFNSDANQVVGKVVPFAPERIISGVIGYTYGLGAKSSLRLELRAKYWDEYYGTYTNTYIKTEEVIIDREHFTEYVEHPARLPYYLDVSGHIGITIITNSLDIKFRIDALNILNRSDNYLRAQYSIDYTRNDFQAGKYNWYVLQAPLFSIFFTTELSLKN